MEKDRDRHINEASKAEQSLAGKEEEVKLKEMLIIDTQKKMQEVEKKLKEQQVINQLDLKTKNIWKWLISIFLL